MCTILIFLPISRVNNRLSTVAYIQSVACYPKVV